MRIHLTHDGKRVAVPVVVAQGDLKIVEGNSPKPSDDMNRYLTAKAKKGQIYQLIWQDPDTEKMRRQQVMTPKDKGWMVIDLSDKK